MSATATIYEEKIHAVIPSRAANNPEEISSEELTRRVSILTRFLELLQTQRDRFRDYLNVLDIQKDAIEQGSVEELTAHVDLEERITADIFSIQKALNPLEAMYGNFKEEDDLELSGLKRALQELSKDAVIRTERNKELLASRMSELRMEIKNLKRIPFSTPPSIYGRNEEPSIIDIRG